MSFLSALVRKRSPVYIYALISDFTGVWEDPRTGWIEGTAILIAVFIVALVTSTNNYSKVWSENASFKRI